MELYRKIIEFVDANVIYCLLPVILTLIIIELIFKNRFETKRVLNVIRWIIIVYAIVTWTITLVGMTLHPEDSAFSNRASGPYKIAYWIMFFAALVPFTLLIKRLASKFWYVLLVAFCLKLGFYFERFVIITTGFHRDYLPKNENAELMDALLSGVGMLFLQGIIIAMLALGIFEIIKRKDVNPT